MLTFLPAPVLGVFTAALLIINLLFWCSIFYVVTALKFVIPAQGWRGFFSRVLAELAESWSGCNSIIISLTQKITWEIIGTMDFNRKGWYLISCNHQSATDIIVLQTVFNRKIPLLRFFLKKELIKVPVLGLAWWALDFPFMKRYSREALQQNPELRKKDRETTRKACEKFKTLPTSILNFMEGTRYTFAKHLEQNSPYKHLLKPKAGGVAFALDAMGEKIRTMLNVTIVYPGQPKELWDYVSGRIRRIIVHIEHIQLSPEIFSGDYLEDPIFRERFQNWVCELWQRKDNLIEQLLEESANPDSVSIKKITSSTPVAF